MAINRSVINRPDVYRSFIYGHLFMVSYLWSVIYGQLFTDQLFTDQLFTDQLYNMCNLFNVYGLIIPCIELPVY